MITMCNSIWLSIRERTDIMGEDNNFGGYQPSDNNEQDTSQNPYSGQQYGQPEGQSYDQNNQNYGQGYGQPNGQYGQGYGQPGGQYDQNYGQYGQNYATQNMNMGGGPGYPQNNMQPQESKGVSIASMVLGIFSLTFGCCITYIGIATAIAGIVTGIISLKNKKPGKGMAIAGVIMSSVALVFLVFCIIFVLTSDTYREMVDEMVKQIQSGNY